MSSKLLRGGAAAAEPIQWRSTGPAPAPGVQKMSFDSAAAVRGGTEGGEPGARMAPFQAEAECRAREAREAGYREGEAAGRKAAEAQVGPVLERLAAAVRQTADLRARLRLEAETDVVRLAVAIARRVLNRELTVDPDALAGLVRSGLDRLRLEESGRLRVHPEHEAGIRELLARSGGLARVEVIADAVLERGAAVFETGRGNLDVSAETQLAEIERGLTDRLRRQMP